MRNLAELKARLLKRLHNRTAYACHGRAKAYDMPQSGWGGVPDKGGARWCEELDACGLRFVDYADKIIRLDHTGWYSDSFQDETLRGAVLQFPARAGRARYVAAYEDKLNPGSYLVDLSEIFIGQPGGDNGDDEQAKRDAARAADGFAEDRAEKSREYDESWQAGREYADLGESIAADRKAALELIAEIKASRPLRPAICATLRAQVKSLRNDIAKARAKRTKLADNVWREYRAAFNDGAGGPVLA